MDNLQAPPLSLCLSFAGLVAGTTTTYTTANAVTYSIGGIAYNKAAVTAGATPTLDTNTGAAFIAVAANTGCAFLFGFDAAGNLKVAQGPAQALDVAGNFFIPPQFPVMPDTATVFGYLVFKGGATLAAPWVFGVGNLSAVTGAVFSFKNLVTLPGRPVVA